MFRDVTFPPQEAWPEEANARRLATVLKGLSDAFLVVDRDWRYQYVNQAMLDRMGVEESDLIGKAVWDLYPEAVGNEAYAQLQRAMNDRVTVDYEFFYEPWNGWYRARAYPIAEGGLAIYSSDVTEEKNSAEKARLGEELVSRLVELSPFGCYIIDSDFKFVLANAGSIDGAFAHIRPLLGRRFDEVVRILWPAKVADELIELFWHTLRTGEPYASKDFVEPRRDVDRVEGYEFSLHQITMPDGRPAVVCYYFDATELRDNERALRESESKLQNLNSELHRLVEERSQQLASSHKEVSGLLEKVAITREEEQRRIGQDLHDHLGQAVTGLRLTVENLLQRYDDPELVESLETLRKVSASLDADVSYLAWMLRPKVLDDLGLASALGQFVREFSGRYDLNAQFEVIGVSDDKLEPEVQTNLYRIAQEALTNCAKHADARHVSILLNQDADALGLIIEDDGCGFDEQSPPTNNGTHGLGLAGMRDRAKLIGADLSIESSDQGTTIFVRLPFPESSERALSRTREENTSA